MNAQEASKYSVFVGCGGINEGKGGPWGKHKRECITFTADLSNIDCHKHPRSYHPLYYSLGRAANDQFLF